MSESEFRALRYSDFLMRAELIQEFRKEDKKNQMIAASWTAWLLGAMPKESFDGMLIHYGLKEKPAPLTPEERHEIAQKAYENAAKIIELDQRRERQ
jgi:hypothetical protein